MLPQTNASHGNDFRRLVELTSQPEPEAAYLSPRSSVRTIKIDIFFRLSFASWESYGYYRDDRYRLLHCIISLLLLNPAFLVSFGAMSISFYSCKTNKRGEVPLKILSTYFRNFQNLCCRSRNSLRVPSITENFPS